MYYEPLVSVFVVTYNSGEYILEALESVKVQSYQNIELIVSDDKSTDNTVQIVKDWIDANGERFVRTQLVCATVNTGTSGNYNRAVKACRGEWLKMLDGDDLLLENCIDDFVRDINDNPHHEIIFSNYGKIQGKRACKKFEKSCMSNKYLYFKELNSLSQFFYLLKGNILTSSACFIKAYLLKNNPYDEKYTILEDIPMWQKLTKLGNKIYFLEKDTILYRLEDSVTSTNDHLFSQRYMEIRMKYFEEVEVPFMCQYNLRDAYNQKRKYFMWYNWCKKYLHNKRNIITIPISYLFKIIVFKLKNFQLPKTHNNEG